MKKQGINLTIVLLFLIAGWTTSQAQELNVPGDNFSLEGALELFKKSASPEEFEKMLNDPETKVNNLDLNGDGYIDYIRVIDKNKKNVHVFIMQAIISDSQAQDVAVITLEKLSNGKAVLQITGDEDVYGVETIIEPTAEVRTYGGTQTSRAVVNVWAWPSVQYIYSPYYSGWVSPWGWGYSPVWWSPWRPIPYYSYYPYWRPYYAYYSPCYVHRVVYAEHIYRPHRTTSVIVINRNREQIQRYRSSYVNNERSADYSRNSSSVRQRSTSERYDSNGRLSTKNTRVSSRSSSDRILADNERSSVSSRSSSNTHSGTDLRTSSGSLSTQRSSGIRSNEFSGNSTSNARESRAPGNVDRNRSSEGSTQTYQRSSSNSSSTYGSASVGRQSAPNVERGSSGSSSARQSSQSYDSQRSASGSSAVQRSSGSSSSQRSSGFSSSSRSSNSSGASSSAGRSSNESSEQSTSSESQRGRRR